MNKWALTFGLWMCLGMGLGAPVWWSLVALALIGCLAYRGAFPR